MTNNTKLNLGCGARWEKFRGYDGLDIINFGQKYVGDSITLLKGFENNSYDEVLASHFLEHFNQDDLKIIFTEVNRILKSGAIFNIFVPHMKKGEAWYLSHKTFWCEKTFKWLEREEASNIYGFGKWKIESLVCNKYKNINARLIKII